MVFFFCPGEIKLFFRRFFRWDTSMFTFSLKVTVP